MTEPGRTREILAANLERIRRCIESAASKAGRDPAGVALVAVTKTQPASVAGVLVGLGVADLGENRVQEAEKKAAEVGSGAVWHMIGRLQTNKVRKALRVFSTIHSVDSARLAGIISREAASECPGRGIPVYLEVNVSGEASKSGFRPSDVTGAVEALRGFPNLDLMGLMTMAPYSADPGACRPYFAGLRQIRDRIAPSWPGGRDPGLSMGMSGDFMAAVEEGATVVRIGSALFEGISRDEHDGQA